MLLQLFIGSALMLISILIVGCSLWILETLMAKAIGWLSREPQRLKMVLVMWLVSIWALGVVTVGVWLWALTFLGLGIFADLESSVYFALVAYTTLGFGDILLPDEWRLLSGLAATNGLLTFGALTAILVEAVRQLRNRQLERRGK